MPKVYLRALEPEDYKISIKWRKDDSTWSLLGGTKYFVSEAYEKKWVEEAIFGKGDIKLAICDAETDVYIGNIYLNKIDKTHRSAVLGILIGDKGYRGKGYGSEAIHHILRYSFEELGLHRVSALILEDNIASRRTFEKLGFVQDGILRESLFKGGKFRNQVVVSLLESEFKQKI